MSKKIHIPVDTMGNVIKGLNIGSTDIIGMFGANSGHELTTILASEDEKTYDKYTSLIEGDNGSPITNYKDKKGYIIPGSEISADKLKLICKEHCIKVTNVVADAEVFITNDNTTDIIQCAEVPKNKLMMSINNGYAVTEFGTPYERLDDWMSGNAMEHMLYDTKVAESLGFNLHSVETDSLPYDAYLYTGLAIEILDRLVNDGIETIAATRVVDESPNQVDLTEDLLATILQMSNGSDDRLLLVKILPTLRTDVNFHLLWELANEISEYDMNLRDKDIKYWWYNKFNYSTLSRQSAQDFVVEHHEADTLSNEAFKYMEPKIRKDIQIYNRELYTFKVEFKEEFKKYYERTN